jgi:branched-chain amino acid transport system ATP-binding protein
LETPLQPILSVQGLSRRFGQIVVADDLSFSVSLGECLGIIGPNGAGKTSVFNILSGGLRPDAGRVVLEGRDITGLPIHARTRLGIGRTFQVPQPLGKLTTYENVFAAASFAADTGTRDVPQAAWAILERTGLDRRATMLAGGLPLLDRKRLELARAMALRPRLLLLDEIAGGLTEAEVHELILLIQGLKPDVAIVWIEHVTHALQAVADRIFAINFGRKIAEGLPDDVIADAAVQEIYMGAVIDAAVAS